MSSDRKVAYVAAGPIPPSKPPASEVGVIHWLRRNLFNGMVDSILTLISITAIVLLVPPLVDWAFLKGVWNANSLDECREIIAAAHGEGVTGACWAVINERFNQFIFGFYPPELYWRPLLAFALMGFAAVPVLFDHVPYRKYGLMYSAIFPIIAYFLIWGGLGLEPVDSDQIGGFLLVITISVTGIAAALPIGIVLALGRQSSMFFFRTICAVFMEFIRGVPLIVLLFAAFVLLIFMLPPGTRFDLILWAALVLALPSGVYMAEAIRGGLAALPRGQYEAATALGFGYWKATRLIILPQALKTSTPRIVNASIGLFRNTSLVSIIGLLNPVGLLNPIRAISNWHGILWELYIFVALLFWIFCFSMSRYSMYFENKLKSDH